MAGNSDGTTDAPAGRCWAVVLEGTEADLDRAVREFGDGRGGVRVAQIETRDGARVVVLADAFVGLLAALQAHKEARRIIRLINGLLRIWAPACRPLNLGSVVVEQVPDGGPVRQHHVLVAEPGAFELTGSDVRFGGDAPPSPLPEWLGLARRDKIAGEVLGYLEGEPGWVELHNAFEVMNRTLNRAGGGSVPAGWPGKKRIKTFTWNANRAKRHPPGHSSHDAEPPPMSLAEARAFVAGMAQAWFAWRLEKEAASDSVRASESGPGPAALRTTASPEPGGRAMANDPAAASASDPPRNPARGPAAVRLRPATRADAPAIARLFLVSSDGLAAYIWGLMAPAMPGLTLEQIGAARYARDGVAFSWQNCTVAEAATADAPHGAVVAMLHAYRIDPPDPAAPPDPNLDPVLRPYQELEDPGSLYISGIAVLPDWRGHGLGSRLMAVAEARARAEGLPRLSLICFEANAGAARLYRRLGFRVVDRRALVPHPCLRYQSGDALLMVRDLG